MLIRLLGMVSILVALSGCIRCPKCPDCKIVPTTSIMSDGRTTCTATDHGQVTCSTPDEAPLFGGDNPLTF